MNQTQRKHLRERINSATRAHERKAFEALPMTAEVVQAKAIVDAWEEQDDANEQRIRKEIREAKKAVEEVLFFDNAETALKAVKDFEEMKF